MSSPETKIQYGVVYPNGVAEWSPENWFGALNSPESRANFQEQYDLKVQALGVPAQRIKFVQREVYMTYGEATELIDEPEPS